MSPTRAALLGRIAAYLVALGATSAQHAAEPAVAAAQAGGFRLNQYRPAETPDDGFVYSSPRDAGDSRFGVQGTIDYSNDPLVFEGEPGIDGGDGPEVIEHLGLFTLGGFLGLADRVVVSLALPVYFSISTDPMSGIDPGSAPALGDPALAGRVRILGEPDQAFHLGGALTLTMPVADLVDDAQSFGGDGGFTVHPEVLAEIRAAKLRAGVNLGVLVRGEETFENIAVGPELTWVLGAGYEVLDGLEARLEAFGATGLARFGDREESPIELLLGARATLDFGLVAGLAGGIGIGRGYGTPDFRIAANVGWATARPAQPEAEAGDSDGDETVAGDADNDGVFEPDDRCPVDPEDLDGHDDTDGCPDPDAPGPSPSRETPRPTPAPANPASPAIADADRDQVPDAADACVNEPEDWDRFDDENGCPDPDNDQDGLADGADSCPVAPGPAGGNGCPTHVRFAVGGAQIELVSRIESVEGGDRLVREATPILEEIRATLAANPYVRRVRIEGHTGNRGSAEQNTTLSGRRARNVMAWLVERGIAADRLEAVGCGAARPVADNASQEGRTTNRRIEIHVVDPAPARGGPDVSGCQPVQ